MNGGLKIIHTSDWHLGKKLLKKDRLPEQRLFLDWLISHIKKENIQALFISGDIFDTPSPSHQAVKLYFNFLHDLSSQTSCQVFIIGGNHDSGIFLEAPSALLSDKKIHLCGTLADHTSFFHLVSHQPESNQYVVVAMLPFFRNFEILHFNHLENEPQSPLDGFLDKFKQQLKYFIQQAQQDNKIISKVFLLAHHLFGSYIPAGSEQALFLSGVDSISPKVFAQEVDYLALGHIHQFQVVSKSTPYAVYSGSPYPLRFGESNQKFLHQIEVTLQAQISYQKVLIPEFRKLITLELSQKEFVHQIEQFLQSNTLVTLPYQLDALVEIKMNLSGPQTGLSDQLRTIFKDLPAEVLSLKFSYPQTKEYDQDLQDKTMASLHSPEELFKLFFKHKFPHKELSEKQLQVFNQLLEKAGQKLDNSSAQDEK